MSHVRVNCHYSTQILKVSFALAQLHSACVRPGLDIPNPVTIYPQLLGLAESGLVNPGRPPGPEVHSPH